ncbi:hypothetical protein SASPL_114483 [Salvia splendens]|uniref:Profilin n=2 Tax=Salvia splendens TaxID=180675 RepID=A0A8X8Y0Q8_SALSN|nr:profilin-like [Salvia splendens]XP_042060826.1 profilin-like [Salvia splendens]KAG6424071.1 hypothetical protein SASPL_114483 [Salvia splendens]
MIGGEESPPHHSPFPLVSRYHSLSTHTTLLCFYLRFSIATMSWQSYIDDHLMADVDGCHLTSSAIVGHDGSVWAQSSNFPQFKPEEVTAIMNDFDNPGSLAPTGLYIGGTKYMVIQGEPNAVIRGKKGSGGATIKKTNLALIIGIYDEPMAPGQCNMVVEKIGDYLIEQGL